MTIGNNIAEENIKNLNRILMGKRVAQIDKMAIDRGIESKWLMKNAGTGMAREIISHYKNAAPKRIPRVVIICGGGNN